MPYRRYGRRGKKRKRVYKRKSRYSRRSRRLSRIPRWGGISLESTFRKAVKFRYVSYIKLDATGAAPSSYIYRANSPYDPDYAIGGASVLKWDYYQNLYKYYICVGSKIKVNTLGENVEVAAPSYPGVLTLYLSNDATGFGTWEDYIANARGSYILTSGAPSAYTKKKLSCRFSAKKFFNIKDVRDNFDAYGAATNANPPEDAYFILTQDALITGNNPQAVNCVVIIDYWVIFSEPLNTFFF